MPKNLNGQVRARSNHTHLERVRAFVTSHGVDAWVEEGAVKIISNVCHLPGVWSQVTDTVATLADARAVLGY